MTDQKKGPGRPGRTVSPKDYSVIATNIDRRMQDLGIKTKVQLAAISGVSRTVITNIFIMPNKGVMAESAVNLAKALECRVEWLISGEGPVTEDDIFGAPILTFEVLESLSSQQITAVIESARQDPTVKKAPCPTGYGNMNFAVALDSNINFEASKKYRKYEQGGIAFFESQKKPRSGELVLALPLESGTPAVMEYSSAHSKAYLSVLNDNFTESIRTVELAGQMEILGTFIGYSYTA